MATNQYTVLVVDDEPAVLRVAVLALERGGFRVLTACSGEEAERTCAEHDGSIDAVVMDVHLETGTGFDAMPSLNRLRPAMKALYVAGYPGRLMYDSLAKHVPFLSKPFTAKELVRAVSEILGIIRGSVRILVVDDEEDMVDCLKLMLEGRTWTVEGVSNPLDALQRVRDARFDAVVTDVRMPQMSGLELMREVTRIQPDLKVILISGHLPGDEATVGAFAFLSKPFKSGRLVKLIERALETKRSSTPKS